MKKNKRLIAGTLTGIITFSLIGGLNIHYNPRTDSIEWRLGAEKALANTMPNFRLTGIKQIEYCPENKTVHILRNDGTCAISGNSTRNFPERKISNYKYIPHVIPLKDITKIFPVYNGCYYRTSNGDIYTTGDAKLAGNPGSTTSCNHVPVKFPIKNIKKIVSVDRRTTYYLTDEGDVYFLGDNISRHTGIDGRDDSTITSPIKLKINNIRDVKVSRYHVFFISKDNKAYWSCDTRFKHKYFRELSGLLNTPDDSIKQLPFNNVRDIKVNPNKKLCVVLTKDNSAYMFGSISEDYPLTSGVMGREESYLYFKQFEKIPVNNIRDVIITKNNGIFTLSRKGEVYYTGSDNNGCIPSVTEDTARYKTYWFQKLNWKNIVSMKSIETDRLAYYSDYSNDIFVLKDKQGNTLLFGNTYTEKYGTIEKPTIFPELKNKDIYRLYGSLMTYSNGKLEIIDHKKSGDMNYGQHKGIHTKDEVRDVTSAWFYDAYDAIDKVHDLDKVKEYGAWTNRFSGVDSITKSYRWFNRNTSDCFNGVIDKDQISKEFVLPNSSVIAVDNYGMVNYYRSYNEKDPKTINTEGKNIKDVFLANLQGGQPEPFLVKNDGSIYRVNTSNMEEELLPIKENQIKRKFIYHSSGNYVKYFMFELNDDRLVYLDSKKQINEITDKKSFTLKPSNIREVIHNTRKTSDIFVLKDGTLRTDSSKIDLKGKTVKRVLSNRYVELSDGCIWTLNGSSINETKIRADLIKKCVNDLCWLKNGKVIQVESSNIKYINDIDCKSIENIVKFDANGTIILMKNKTTKGFGEASGLTDLQKKGIDYNNIQTFLSNDTTNSDMKLIVMKDGTVYDKDGERRYDVRLVGDAYIDIKYDTEPDTAFNIEDEATKIVNIASKVKTKDAVQIADKYIKSVPDEEVQGKLNKILKSVQIVDDSDDDTRIKEAIKAMGRVTVTLAMEDYKIADQAIDRISNSTVKNNMKESLAEVKKQIDALDNRDKACNLENHIKTLVDEGHIKELDEVIQDINGMPTEYKKPLLMFVNMAKSDAGYSEVDEAVSKAEETKNPSDVELAQKEIDKLQESEEKKPYQERLDKVKNEIKLEKAISNAESKVKIAEQTPTQETLDEAVKAISEIPDDIEKGQTKRRELTERTDKLKELVNNKVALDLVETAEREPTQENYDKANKVVEALTQGKTKLDLQNRLKVVKETIEANKELYDKAVQDVEKAEKSLTEKDYSTATESVQKVKEPSLEKPLTERLNKVRTAIDNEKINLTTATKAVETAEQSKKKEDVITATEKVNILKEGEDKNKLLQRVKAIVVTEDEHTQKEEEEQAEKAVQKAESTKKSGDILIADKLINVLSEPKKKKSLKERLDQVVPTDVVPTNSEEDLQKAESAVSNAEKTRKKVNVENAREIVNKLKESKEKLAFITRLDLIDVERETDHQAVVSGTPTEATVETKVRMAVLPNITIKTDKVLIDLGNVDLAEKSSEKDLTLVVESNLPYDLYSRAVTNIVSSESKANTIDIHNLKIGIGDNYRSMSTSQDIALAKSQQAGRNTLFTKFRLTREVDAKPGLYSTIIKFIARQK